MNLELLQEAFFLPVDGDRCFCIWRAPATGSELLGVVVHIPAFAEEMNKSRRMVAAAARAYAQIGFGVLEIDLAGCGDSSGNFGDATLPRWVENVVSAIAWVRTRTAAPICLWSLRAGALLIPQVLSRVDERMSLLLWQPVLSGKQYLTQFLRLKLASEMLASTAEGGGMQQLRARLQAGEYLEIGGYYLSPTMARALEAAQCDFTADRIDRVAWFEITASDAPVLSPSARTKIDSLVSTGRAVVAQALTGPSFWQSVEIEECASLIEASRVAIAQRQR